MTTSSNPQTIGPTTPVVQTTAGKRAGLRISQAARWMISGLLLLIAVGTQLFVDLKDRTVDAGSFVGSYWLQIVIVATALVLLVGGIVKSRHQA